MGFSLLICIFPLRISAASIQINHQSEAREGWTPEPIQRGTFSIILTCVVTLALCAWTAIHPDIVARSTTSQRIFRKLHLSFRDLFLPESVVSDAREQWAHARQLYLALRYANALKKMMKELDKPQHSGPNTATEDPVNDIDIGNAESLINPHHVIIIRKLASRMKNAATLEGEDTRRSGFRRYLPLLRCHDRQVPGPEDAPFGMQVALFVVMGGYVRNDEQRTRITCDDFLFAFLADQEKLEGLVNEDDIIDKGKASVLAKIIVCAQCGWFLVNLVGRWISDLPMALLEIHIGIHILIAAAIYGFWWDKRLDVNEPIGLDIGPSNNLTSEVWWTTFAWALWPPGNGPISVIKRLMMFWPPSPKATDSELWLELAVEMIQPSQTCSITVKGPSTDVNTRFESTFNQLCSKCMRRGAAGFLNLPKFLRRSSGKDGRLPSSPHNFSETTSAVLNTPSAAETNLAVPQDAITRVPSKSYEPIVNPQMAPNRAFDPSEKDPFQRHVMIEYFTACIFYILYSGLHTVAWNSEFPSKTERWAWRGSCLVVGIVPVGILVLSGLGILILRINIGKKKYDEDALKRSQKIVEYILVVVYLVASLTLLVLRFLTLRSLPSGTYARVGWTTYLPHI